MKLALDKLIIDRDIQVRRGLNEATVEKYSEILDQLPPILVVETKQGERIVADGFHRVAGAQRRGNKALPVKVVQGTRKLALELAATANTAHGQPLNPEERDFGIRRLRELHPDWAATQVASKMHCSATTVEEVVKRDKVKSKLGLLMGLGDEQYGQLAKLPTELWEPVAATIQQKAMTTGVSALLVRNIRDTRLPEDYRKKLVAGRADPVVINRDGSYSLPIETVARQVREVTERDPALALEQALLALARLRQHSWPDIYQHLDRIRMERLRSELPGYIRFLEQGLRPTFEVIEHGTR